MIPVAGENYTRTDQSVPIISIRDTADRADKLSQSLRDCGWGKWFRGTLWVQRAAVVRPCRRTYNRWRLGIVHGVTHGFLRTEIGEAGSEVIVVQIWRGDFRGGNHFVFL